MAFRTIAVLVGSIHIILRQSLLRICCPKKAKAIMSREHRSVIDLHGKNAAITGASRGIGKEIALTLAKEG